MEVDIKGDRGYKTVGYPLPVAVVCRKFDYKPPFSGYFLQTKANASLLQQIPHLRIYLIFEEPLPKTRVSRCRLTLVFGLIKIRRICLPLMHSSKPVPS
ncbi:hypothetical protein LJK88_28730 [Paenibacillus sp. P26]|nr:hypothetical protein LJK88_28730 [Paenibacillus sp. P26]UUZ94695.1 hypothetical protein LJK87_09305 [Paenibacillus sp. P25]